MVHMRYGPWLAQIWFFVDDKVDDQFAIGSDYETIAWPTVEAEKLLTTLDLRSVPYAHRTGVLAARFQDESPLEQMTAEFDLPETLGYSPYDFASYEVPFAKRRLLASLRLLLDHGWTFHQKITIRYWYVVEHQPSTPVSPEDWSTYIDWEEVYRQPQTKETLWQLVWFLWEVNNGERKAREERVKEERRGHLRHYRRERNNDG